MCQLGINIPLLDNKYIFILFLETAKCSEPLHKFFIQTLFSKRLLFSKPIFRKTNRFRKDWLERKTRRLLEIATAIPSCVGKLKEANSMSCGSNVSKGDPTGAKPRGSPLTARGKRSPWNGNQQPLPKRKKDCRQSRFSLALSAVWANHLMAFSFEFPLRVLQFFPCSVQTRSEPFFASGTAILFV